MSFKCVDAAKLYEKDPNLRKRDVEEIQIWLKDQHHLPKMEDIQVMGVLHKNHYVIDETKSSIDNYMTIRSSHPEVFGALTPDALKSVTSVACFNILPKKTPEGYIIIMLKLLDTKAGSFNFTQITQLGFMVLSLHYHQIGFEKGVVILVDMKGASFGHLIRLNLNVIRCTFKLLQNAAPIKVKGFHLMNAMPLTDKLVALLKPFLKVKVYKKIQAHFPSSDTIYKFLPKECLCEEHGGDLPSCEILNERSVKNMLDNYEFYVWHDNQKVDETKRKLGRS